MYRLAYNASRIVDEVWAIIRDKPYQCAESGKLCIPVMVSVSSLKMRKFAWRVIVMTFLVAGEAVNTRKITGQLE
jgi:hypothetical protein